MLLRHMTKHVNDQNWFAVGLDFVIVVVGVFFGIQIGNWNEARQDQAAYAEAQARVIAEARGNLDLIAANIATAQDYISEAETAIDFLTLCKTGADDLARFNDSARIVAFAVGFDIRREAIEQISLSERFKDMHGTDIGATHNVYFLNLNRIDNSNEISRLLWAEALPPSDHPLMGYGDIEIQTIRRIDTRWHRIELDADLSTACQDKSLAKLFYNRHRLAMYQLYLMQQVKQTTEMFLTATDAKSDEAP